MPAFGNIAINDGQATPVSHVFAPVTIDGARAKFANRSSGLPAGFERLELEMREPKSSTGAYRLLYKMTLPITATVNSVLTVVRINSANGDLNFAQGSSSAERNDLAVLTKNLLGHATVTSMVQNLETVY